jgi:glycosyltransferase involved in cell wall biosynthesis
VVSTPVGAEGLPVRDGVDALLATEPQELADAVIALLRDPARASALGQAGAALVRERFGWGAVTAHFADACRRTIAGRAPEAGSAPARGQRPAEIT